MQMRMHSAEPGPPAKVLYILQCTTHTNSTVGVTIIASSHNN